MSYILVCDDEKIISMALSRVLIRAGHEVKVANHGTEAIRAMNEGPAPAMVFLDLLMPEIGGGEVLDFIHRKAPETKVMMMTAYGDSTVRDGLMARGATKVLHKPFDDITKIPDLVREFLG
ncbi:MAG: response regulator [Proteobacteria bacterium]|nr:MAG: response regulator [Pseudomonadota bacterium]